MILSDLKSYLKEQRRVALADLIIHFNIDADALRGMLDKWISKGKVRKLPLTASCGTSCCQCDASLTEIYEWVDE
ncbi:FeoC-like transcriptional regulator [Methylobacter sp.]|uniref:FeoC-like transcriptional regulator n=1 Tax=Methylobacter sp. TaxID=2051955 RepID=UPI00121A5044|nr:FeoC-like transcriptional regulator [Methylobacter sp.]TAK64559.1 MAG: sugar metabolism transcriptional regulator [Methylobacter sp.]